MKPEQSGYRISNDERGYFVEHVYDLMFLNKWHACNSRNKTKEEAKEQLDLIMQLHLKSYERLAAQGLTFPHND